MVNDATATVTSVTLPFERTTWGARANDRRRERWERKSHVREAREVSEVAFGSPRWRDATLRVHAHANAVIHAPHARTCRARTAWTVYVPHIHAHRHRCVFFGSSITIANTSYEIIAIIALSRWGKSIDTYARVLLQRVTRSIDYIPRIRQNARMDARKATC